MIPVGRTTRPQAVPGTGRSMGYENLHVAYEDGIALLEKRAPRFQGR